MEFAYTVTSSKDFDAAVQAVQEKIAEKGFRVMHIHDVQATLASKGFQREPLKIVETCNARYASQVLERDINIGLFMPCKINVYTEKGHTVLSALRPAVLADFFPQAGVEEIAREVDGIIRSIVDEAR